MKDYALDQWHGLLAPAATPPAVIDRINVAVARIMQRPDVQVALREQGFTPATSTPAAFQSMIRADIPLRGARESACAPEGGRGLHLSEAVEIHGTVATITMPTAIEAR